MEVIIIIIIFRVIYLVFICIDLFLMVKYVLQRRNRSQNVLYYSGIVFGTSLFIALLINFTLFMTDFVGKSWHSPSDKSLIIIAVYNIGNFLVTPFVIIGTKKHLEIKDASFVVYRLLAKPILAEFSSIDINKSEMCTVMPKSIKLFPNRNIFGAKEYLLLHFKDGTYLNINMNQFLFSGNFTLLRVTILKLKIKRKLIEK